MFPFIRQLFAKQKIIFFSAVIILVIFFSGIFSSYIVPFDPYEINPEQRLEPPSLKHFFGTDNFGRDTFSRIITGAKSTFLAGIGVVVFSLVSGVLFGLISAYYPKIGLVLMRIIDIILGFPSLLLALALITILQQSFINTIIAVGAVYMATTARIVYGLSLKIITETYIEAAQALGVSNFKILFFHILPNLISPLIVQMTFVFAFAQLQIAALDFLGLGLPPEVPSWGNMLSETRIYINRAPWLLWFPGSMIIITVLCFNLLGDYLRDKLDPKFKNEI